MEKEMKAQEWQENLGQAIYEIDSHHKRLDDRLQDEDAPRKPGYFVRNRYEYESIEDQLAEDRRRLSSIPSISGICKLQKSFVQNPGSENPYIDNLVEQGINVPFSKEDFCLTPAPAFFPATQAIDEDAPSTHKGTNYRVLANKFLQLVPVKRYGERIYIYQVQDGFYHPCSDGELSTSILQYLDKEIGKIGGANMLRYVADYVIADPRINDSPNDDPNLICVENGVIDIQQMAFYPHSPSYFFTSSLKVGFYQNVPLTTPIFDRFLWQISGGDQELVQCIWQMIGYLLTTDMKAKKFFVLQGVGNSGKSVLGNLIAGMFHTEAVSHLDIFQFKERFSTSALTQCRLNISMDLPNKKLDAQAVGTIKQLTGGDAIMVEEKYKAVASYQSQCKLVFGTNHPLNFDMTDQAFASRILLIPFQYAIPKEQQDPGLLEKLINERSEIALRALNAYRNLVQNGYRFVGEERFSVAVNLPQYTMGEEEIMDQFIQARCTFEADTFSTTEELHKRYLEFCISKGFPAITERNLFSREFNTRCNGRASITKKRIGGTPQNGYSGVKVD